MTTPFLLPERTLVSSTIPEGENEDGDDEGPVSSMDDAASYLSPVSTQAQEPTLEERLRDKRLLRVSLSMTIPWSAISRDGVVLVEVGTRGLPAQVGGLAQQLLTAKPVPNWKDARQGRWRGITLSIMDDECVWSFSCVFNGSKVTRPVAQYCLEEIIAGSEGMRSHDVLWKYGHEYACQNLYVPVLQRRLQEFAYWGAQAAADTSLQLASEIVRENKKRVRARQKEEKHTKQQVDAIVKEQLRKLESDGEEEEKKDPAKEPAPKRSYSGPWTPYASDRSVTSQEEEVSSEEETYWTNDAIGEEESYCTENEDKFALARSETSKTSPMSDQLVSSIVEAAEGQSREEALDQVLAILEDPEPRERKVAFEAPKPEPRILEVNVQLNAVDDTSLLTEHPIEPKQEEPRNCFFCTFFRSRPSALC